MNIWKEFNKERIANSIPMYLDAVKSAISYSYQAKALAQKASGEDKKYYEFEGKTGEYFANTYLSWLQGMVKHELEDERTQAGLLESEKKLINKEFAKIIDADFVDKTQLINEFSKFYREN